MKSIIARLREVDPNVSIVMHNSWERRDNADAPHPWANYLTTLAEIADEDNALLGDTNARPLGYGKVPAALRDSWDAETIHLNPQGYGVVANAMYAAVDRP